MTDETTGVATDESVLRGFAELEGITFEAVSQIKQDVTSWEIEIEQARASIAKTDDEYVVGAADLRIALVRLRESVEARQC